MAINYEPVGWDTTKHFNPTNMNHMDGGIKAACDNVDKHDSEIAEINSNLNTCFKNSRIKYGNQGIVGFSTTMKSITINFDTPFGSVPIVLISPITIQYEGGDNLFQYIALDNVTKASFKVVYKATEESSTWTWSFNWIAIL